MDFKTVRKMAILVVYLSLYKNYYIVAVYICFFVSGIKNLNKNQS